MMEGFAKPVNGHQEPLTNLTKRSITDVRQGPKSIYPFLKMIDQNI